MSSREAISSENAPEAVGPYSQAIRDGRYLFCSGQIPLDPESGEIIEGGVAEQTDRCLRNLAAICSQAGTSLSQAVKLTIFTTDLDSSPEINQVYARHFEEAIPPARATLGVSSLPLGAKIEIDAIVVCEDES